MCVNYAFDPPPRMIRIRLTTPPPLCDFEQWIDTEINESDKRYLELKKWEAERLERLEKRHREEPAEKERKEELWKGGMLLSDGRRGSKSLSVFAVPKQHWRRI
ncbi:hypothetical protein PVAP13_5NG182481 [Panicum virgatum]|uniref:Uncharacterized protein n=1 Tax=Panicum virgatum TaxID=38727 RepID=A0A8T0RTN8_PANVG|nr:hypothetical protein PVAP13_5NG182481 [Panicum virgatum]